MAKSIVFNQKDHKNDILLLKEIVSLNTFANPDKWETVASNLNSILKPTKLAVERTVRDRAKLIIKKFKAEEQQSKKDSGPAEDFSEYKQLLTQVVELQEDAEFKKATVLEQKKKVSEDIKAGEEIRKQAMTTKASTSAQESDSETDELSENSGEESDLENFDPNFVQENSDDSVAETPRAKIVKPKTSAGPTKTKAALKKQKASKKAAAQDPFMDFLAKKMKLEERKLKLEESKEERRHLELQERREERKQNMQLMHFHMNKKD